MSSFYSSLRALTKKKLGNMFLKKGLRQESNIVFLNKSIFSCFRDIVSCAAKLAWETFASSYNRYNAFLLKFSQMLRVLTLEKEIYVLIGKVFFFFICFVVIRY